MRVYLGAAALVVLVVGGFWLALALFSSNSKSQSADAFTKSATCVRNDRSLGRDQADGTRFHIHGLRALGLSWDGARAVAFFADSPDPVRQTEARLASSLRSQGVSIAEIRNRLLQEDDVGLFYVDGSPSLAAQTAIGSCVYLIRYNRIASFFGLYLSPHARRPFLPGARRDDPPPL
jgi:hypothetical protein